MLRTLIGKAGNMQEQMGNVRGEMESLRKNQKEILDIKNTIREMRNAFDGFLSRLGMAEEKISELNIGQQKLSKGKCKEKNNE